MTLLTSRLLVHGILIFMRYTHDTLGRVKYTPHTQNPIKDFMPNKRHIQWMQFLNLHGCLPSEYLYEYTREEMGNKHNFREAIKKLYDGGMIYKPKGQRATEYPDRYFHCYDLTEKGKQYLKDNGLWVEALRPTGNWVHQLFISCITATVHIMCIRSGYRYIPPHEYLNGKPMKYDVLFDWDDGPHTVSLGPDAVFAIDYGDKSFIAYALEADRNTEPSEAKSWKRKSDLRTVRQYGNFISKRMYKKAYGREAMMMLLYVTVGETHAQNFLDIVARELGSPPYVTVGVEDAFRTPFYPPKLLTHLFEEPLLRAGREGWTLKREA